MKQDAVRGAYGLRLGLPVKDDYLVDSPGAWPYWDLRWELVPASHRDQRIGADEALVNVMPAGQVLINRASQTSRFFLPSPPKAEAWPHPHLASTAAMAAWWAGRQAFHAGSFVCGGSAWGVLGERDGGKTSMLAWLTAHGYPIVCDDLLVVDNDHVFAGPRCLDLREQAAEHFGIGNPIGHVGSRERWRHMLGPVAATVPLGGWVVPEWSDEILVAPLRVADKLTNLFVHRSPRVPGPAGPEWLDLVEKPMVRFCRPKDWDALDNGMQKLLHHLLYR